MYTKKTNLDIPVEKIREAAKNYDNPKTVYDIGLAAVSASNEKTNVGPVKKILRNKWTKAAAVLAAGSLIGYRFGAGVWPSLSIAGDSAAGNVFSKVGQGLTAAPAHAWNLLPGTDNTKTAITAGVGAFGIMGVIAAGKSLLRGGQQTRDKYRSAKDAVTREQRKLDSGTGIALHHQK